MRKIFAMVMALFILTSLMAMPEARSDENEKEKIVKLDEIVVTAPRETKVIDTPASISVITAKELEEQGIKNIGDAIVRIPGAYDDGASTYHFSMRGTRSSSAGGPLVLIDGVPQNMGMSDYNYFETIPVSDIDRIEILRSPGSTAFGAGSARGVISIITKKGKKDQPFSVKAKTSYGSWQTSDTYATLSGGVNNWDFFLNGTFTDTDGYVHNDQRRKAGRFKVGYNFSDYARLGINLGYTDNDYKTVRGKNKYALEIDRRAREFKEKPTAEKTSYDEKGQDVSSYALDFSYKKRALFLDSLAAVTLFDEEAKYNCYQYTKPKRVYDDDRDQNRYKFDLSGGYSFGEGFFSYTPVLGFNVEKTALEQRRDYFNDPVGKAASKRKADIDYDQEKFGIFLQNQLLFGDHGELNLGVRSDKVTYDVKNKKGDSVDKDHTKYSWSVAPAYHWNDRATTYALVGKSYWYPAAYYYKVAMEKMNPENLPQDLEPESSLVYEIGHKHSLAKWANIDFTLFWMDYKDKFAVFYDETSKYAGYKNIGDAEHKGIELEIDGRICRWFGYRLSGTYMEAEWTSGRERVYTWETLKSKDFRDLDGKELNRVPNYKYMVGLDLYPIRNLKFNIDVNGTGKYYVDYLNRIEYGERTTVDMGIRYEFKKWSFWVLGKNIFDREIEAVYNSSGKLNSTVAEIERNGKYANLYYPRNGQYFEVGITYYF